MCMQPTHAPQTYTDLMIFEQEGDSVSPGVTDNIVPYPDIKKEDDNESPEVPGISDPDPETAHARNTNCGNFSRSQHKKQHYQDLRDMDKLDAKQSAGYQLTNLQQKSGFSTPLTESFYQWVTRTISHACITPRMLRSIREKSCASKS